MKNALTMFLLFAISASLVFAQSETEKANTGTAKINKTSATNAATYDFTTGSDKYYGGTNGAVEIEAGVWGMIAGDANGDGGIYAEDYTSYQTNQGQENYNAADYNMDGGVYAEDYTIYQLNQGKETSVPN